MNIAKKTLREPDATYRRFIYTWLLASVLSSLLLIAPLDVYAAVQKEGKDWTLNLKDVDIRVFIEQVSSITGENFVVDPEVKGKVSVIATTPMSADAVNELFLTVLRVNGLAAIPSGAVTRIVPQAGVKSGGFSAGAGSSKSGQRMITRVIPVRDAGVEEMVKLLKPLVSQSGYLEGSEFSNALIVSDYADNVAQMAKTLAALDKEQPAAVEVIPLKEAWVGNIVPLIEAVAPMQLGEHGKGHARLRVVADERSNSIVVRGDARDREQIRRLVETFDQKTPNASDIQMIPLRYADATEMARLVRGLLGEESRGGAAPALPGAMAAPNPGAAMGAGMGMGGATPAPGAASATGGQASGAGGNPAVQSLIQADTELNSLIVRAGPSLMSEIRSLVKQLDIPRPQVLIEAAIVEISADKTEQLGVQLTGGDNAATFNGGGTQFSSSGLGLGGVLTQLGSAGAAATTGEGLTVLLGSRNKFDLLIQALANTSGANLLSTPSIITLDNEEAKIVVGQNVPFRTGSFSSQTAGVVNPFTTIEREDIGVTLKVMPQIHEGNLVRLTIEQEVSSIAPANAQTQGAADIITNKRTIQTKVLAEDGQTIVLGGLMEDDTTDTVSKVPLLGDIPVLGALFSSKSQSYTKSNLLVFLRPTVLRGRQDVTDVTQARYGRIYDLQIGKKDLADSPPSAPAGTVPPAGAVFDLPPKKLPWLIGTATTVDTSADVAPALPVSAASPAALPWLAGNNNPGNAIAAPVTPVEVSNPPSSAPLPWLIHK